MSTVSLKSLPAGSLFRWSGVLFEAVDRFTEQEGREMRSVIYRSKGGRVTNGVPAYDDGDKGLMPLDEQVAPAKRKETK